VYVVKDLEKGPPGRSTLHHIRSIGSSVPNRTSTTATWFPSPRIEGALGKSPSWSMITTRCNQAEVVLLRSEANRVRSSIKDSVMKQSKNARVLREGEAEGFDSKVERRPDKSASYSTESASRAGKDDGWNSRESGTDRSRSGRRCLRRNSRMLVRESRGNSTKGIAELGKQENKKLPFGPPKWIALGYDWYSIKPAEGRFERWVVGISDRTSFSPVFWSSEEISRRAPFRRAILEISTWAFIGLLQDIERCWSRFRIGSRRRELRRAGSVNRMSRVAFSSQRLFSKKSKRVSRLRSNR